MTARSSTTVRGPAGFGHSASREGTTLAQGGAVGMSAAGRLDLSTKLSGNDRSCAHSFRTGTGRYDPFGKPSANDRYLRTPALPGGGFE